MLALCDFALKNNSMKTFSTEMIYTGLTLYVCACEQISRLLAVPL